MIRPFDRFSILLRQRRPRLVEPQKVTNTLFERPPLQAVVCTHIEVSTNGTDWIRPLRTVGVFVGYVINAKVYGVIVTSIISFALTRAGDYSVRPVLAGEHDAE